MQKILSFSCIIIFLFLAYKSAVQGALIVTVIWFIAAAVLVATVVGGGAKPEPRQKPRSRP